MLFFAHCVDKPDSLALRVANRPAHVEHLKALGAKVALAGPLLADDGETMVGSLLIFDMENRAAVDAALANDPYAKAGLFEKVEVRQFKKVFG